MEIDALNCFRCKTVEKAARKWREDGKFGAKNRDCPTRAGWHLWFFYTIPLHRVVSSRLQQVRTLPPDVHELHIWWTEEGVCIKGHHCAGDCSLECDSKCSCNGNDWCIRSIVLHDPQSWNICQSSSGHHWSAKRHLWLLLTCLTGQTVHYKELLEGAYRSYLAIYATSALPGKNVREACSYIYSYSNIIRMCIIQTLMTSCYIAINSGLLIKISCIVCLHAGIFAYQDSYLVLWPASKHVLH